MTANRKAASWLLVALSAGSFGVSACSSSQSPSSPGGELSENSGTLGLSLKATGGVVINTASYVLTGPLGFSKTGSLELSAATSFSATIGGIPVGIGYTISLAASAADGTTTCAGSAPFGVTAHTTTTVVVPVECHQAPTTGSISVTGSLNFCPLIDSLSTSADNVFLGASVALSAAAHDADSGPAPLSYAWSTSSGSLLAGSAPNATFSCSAPGPATVTLVVGDGSTCSDTQSVTINCSADASTTFYTTKTPYQPKQDLATYEAPPSGFSSVFTELVARHGSRGLSSVKYDAAAYDMWKKASDDGALTALGATLGADITKIMKANALLGFGVPGITNPGYGNLTRVGIGEQQQLAARLLLRLPGYFAGLAASAGSAAPRSIVIMSSGMDRAVDSAAFFAQSLSAHNPGLASLITAPPALTAYPANAPLAQPAGYNHFLLYFHKLSAKTDLVTNPADPYYQTYQDSLAFQGYATDVDLTAKVSSILATPSATAAARAVLEGLFSADFVNKIDTKIYTFANTGTFSFTSDDGKYSATVAGDGKTKVQSLTDAASMLYNLYAIAPAMTNEANVDFARYIPSAQARVLAYLQDAQDFYQMGPGIAEQNPITYQMAQALEDDFFNEIDAISHGDLQNGAKLRFTHAEIICPFASLLGLKGIFTPVPKASTYSYDTNPWRGELTSPLAANLQWDVVADPSGTLLVKLLYNEAETDFKAACDSARYATASHYYRYDQLKACYGR